MAPNDELPTIEIFDTLRNEKVELEPIEPGKVGMYVCGITVYDLTHIGHARTFIVFDIVQRFLRHVGYEVEFVRNHTDVDDKIIERARELDEPPLELAQRYIEALERDMGELGVDAADVEPRVSGHIDSIIDMVSTLVDEGYAYEGGGDVFYRVDRFDEYGKLSKRNLEDLEAGRSGRVEENPHKEHPFDFVLWKKSKPDEPSWESPWGPGRPGWHIECSVMSTEYLGAHFDIHGGGNDLIFPHHENEIAQSEAATGEPFADIWMHVGMVNVQRRDEEGDVVTEKMSKSLGNFWTTRDVLGGYHPEAIRYFMMTTSYRHPINYSRENLDEATDRIQYLYDTLERIDRSLGCAGYPADEAPPGDDVELVDEAADTIESFWEDFEAALADDFNTPRAIAVLGRIAKFGNELTQSQGAPEARVAHTIHQIGERLRGAGDVLGILGRTPGEALVEIRDRRVALLGLDADEIEDKIAARRRAREEKDWETADALRDELDEMGVEIMDSPEGTTWRMA